MIGRQGCFIEEELKVRTIEREEYQVVTGQNPVESMFWNVAMVMRIVLEVEKL